ncbi:TIGR03620 family F420-dependent LLM class oxidoreductase [Nocardia sp. NRRL S-836]|uniref:TIGR03620 family F420-dependent LLM class oxidoreductase n=1 Tax=Nocardia sp. NRRL S-836 TaxID=1519492 RepID=UPI0006AE1F46|nr:TIGR03620 family F420-dependent LLM class oxidoreductase [Nocardia sp. NRRL S-836]KOV75546.1 hypothetical protein ADL03_44820 [Nocardia sp. NRRL S-836]
MTDPGKFGVWRRDDEWARDLDSAAGFEELGFTTLWTGGTPPADLAVSRQLLARTRSAAVATSIVNASATDPAAVSRSVREVGDRFLLGLGVGDGTYAGLLAYLAELDVPGTRVVLGALGPRALRLAAEHTLGAHPYLTPVAHTAAARPLLPGKLLAPEVTVLVEDDPVRARTAARQFIGRYLAGPSSRNNLLRHGFTEADLAGGGSDRLVDALVAWGTPDEVAGKVREHLAAGADHVAVQFLNGHHEQVAVALGLRP